MKNNISIMKRFLLIAVILGTGVFITVSADTRLQSLDQVYTVDRNNTFNLTKVNENAGTTQQNGFNNSSLDDNFMSGASNKQQRIDPPGDAGTENLPVGDGLLPFLLFVLGYSVIRLRKNKFQTDEN